MIKISVCDDSKYDIEKVQNALNEYTKSKHIEFDISCFTNPEMLIYELEDNKISDLYILDVEMPNKNGFELAEKIREFSSSAIIIFLTSHDEMAHMGYKTKALRYVIKLNLERDIFEAIDSAVSELSVKDEKTITLKRYNDVWRVPYNEIVYVSKVSRQLIISTTSFEEITDSRGIKELFDEINDSRFIFIDRSCFVNIDFIAQINGTSLKLKNNSELAISRRSLPDVKNALLEYWG